MINGLENEMVVLNHLIWNLKMEKIETMNQRQPETKAHNPSRPETWPNDHHPPDIARLYKYMSWLIWTVVYLKFDI